MPNKDPRCEFCAYWRTPVDEGRNICTLRGRVTPAFRVCADFTVAIDDALPFTDDAVGSDPECRALHLGTAAIGARE